MLIKKRMSIKKTRNRPISETVCSAKRKALPERPGGSLQGPPMWYTQARIGSAFLSTNDLLCR
jgi:hypothetical protein